MLLFRLPGCAGLPAHCCLYMTKRVFSQGGSKSHKDRIQIEFKKYIYKILFNKKIPTLVDHIQKTNFSL